MTRYQRTRHRLTLSGNLANLCGAALTIFCFVNLQGTEGEGPAAGMTTPAWIMTVVITAGLFVLGYVLPARRLESMWAWYRQATELDAPPPATPAVRRLALELPLNAAATSLVIWLLAGLVFGISSSIDPIRWP